MIKEYITICKNYYELIKDNKRKLFPYYIGYFLNSIVELLVPIYVAKITENLTNSFYIATIVSIIVYGLLKVSNSVLSYLDMHTYSNFFKNNYVTLYKKVVKEILNFDEEYKKKFSTGRILNSLTSDVINIGEMADNILTMLFNILKCIVIIFYFFKVNILFALFIILVDIIYINRMNYFNNMAIKYLAKQRKVNDQLIGLMNETILGLKDIQTLGFSSTINDKYNTLYRSWKNMYSKKRKYQIFKRTILRCFKTIAKIGVYFICFFLITKNTMTIGVMLIIVSYFDSIFTASENVMSSSESIKEEYISVNRVKDILGYNSREEYVLKKLPNTEGLIEFKNVYFSYNEEKFLQNLNFIIKPNKITAIIGTNGTGKTTIANLLLRLYEPVQGEILLDGNNIQDIDKKVYLNQVSILNQDTYLFNLSIRQNFNLINKDIKRQQEICKLVGINKFIRKLPKGYDTIIDESASNISGGQKRLLSLARTLLKESKILILDEATSSLDIDMTKNISKIIKVLKKNHTIIVITHKKEIVKIADDILTIDKGRVKKN